ncbi:MAG: hypothetical protein MUF51_03520 [Vicinamibacteria bacterium]|nr:hypothetical protein [Vicinamibacteria bacterium]
MKRSLTGLLLTALAIVMLASFVHRSASEGYLFADDVHWILEGRAFHILRPFEIERRTHFYRPVVEIYFAALTRLTGESVAAMHAANVVLHIGNALLVLWLARLLGGTLAQAILTALLFAAHARAVESVAWISGITAVLSTTFILLAMVFHLRAHRSHGLWDRLASSVALVLALFTHESAVVLLPLLIAADILCGPVDQDWRARIKGNVRVYLYALLPLALFLAVTTVVNAQNYVVTEGHYRLGWHFVPNLLRYLVALYIGRMGTLSLVLTGAIVAALFALRLSVLRMGLLFMVVTLMPYSFFTWGGTVRYLYLPAVGFCLALAAGLILLRDALAHKWSSRVGALVMAVLALFLIGRFASYGAKATRDFRAREAVYRKYADAFVRAHPQLAPGATVSLPSPRPGEPDDIYIEPLLRVVLKDSALRVAFVKSDALDRQDR